jgi:hypothetical protein
MYGFALTALLLASPALAGKFSDHRQELFEHFDIDADDALTVDEFGRIKPDYQAFGDADSNRDGKLNRFEFQEAPTILVRRTYYLLRQ